MIFLGLGTNIGDRLAQLRQGVVMLREVVQEMRLSGIYASPALLKPGAPPEWNQPFFNMVVAGETALLPHEMLQKAKEIEAAMGRQQRGVWAPREMDVDIVAWDGCQVEEANLRIPHGAMHERAFVLLPLQELAPQWRHPNGKTLVQLLAECGIAETVKTPLTLFP